MRSYQTVAARLGDFSGRDAKRRKPIARQSRRKFAASKISTTAIAAPNPQRCGESETTR
jgi:hypothetical protein